MLVLPQTPPVALPFTNPNVSSQLVSLRAAIQVSQHSIDTTAYLIHLEDYLLSILHGVKTNSFKYDTIICEGIPWTSINLPKRNKLLKFSPSSGSSLDDKVSWSVQNEIYMTLISITLTYLKKAAELTNEIISQDTNNVDEFNENWKRITSYYKTAISYVLYAMELQRCETVKDGTKLNGILLNVIHKVCEISIQMVILIKFSWINRNAFEYKNETIQTENNSTLCKVANYILQELKVIKNLINNMSLSSNDQVYDFTLDYSDWLDYLNVIEKYINGYAGLFLSLQMYKEDKLGNAIGLVHFSLLSLQSKKSIAAEPVKSKNVLRNVKTKISNKKNDSLLSRLSSVSSLQVDKSAFNEKTSPSSKLILNDLTYLFDQLIKLNLKFTKENDNLKFDTIVNWQDIFVDSKWPTGYAIPVSSIKPYDPFPVDASDQDKHEYAGRGAYY